MSLSSPSPSWFVKTPYCSMRDWTRFSRHRIKKYSDSPVHTLSDSLRIYFFPLWRAYLFFSGFAVEFAGYVWRVAVSGTKKLRPDSKISGYVWTGPKDEGCAISAVTRCSLFDDWRRYLPLTFYLVVFFKKLTVNR